MSERTYWIGRVSGVLRLAGVESFEQLKRRGYRHARGVLTRLYDPRYWARHRGDLFGGTVAALIALPYAMALSIALGFKPEAGIYTSIICGAVYGLLANSPVLISGLSATVVPVLGAVVQQHGVGAALATGFLCGLIMALLGVLRLGRFVSYLPHPVVNGFTSGLGVVIIASQLKSLLGVVPRAASFNLGVLDDFCVVAIALPQVRPATLLVVVIVGATMVLLPRWHEQAPASLIGVGLATGVAWAGQLSLPRVGALPAGVPQPNLSALDFTALPDLMTPALTLAGLCTVNQLLTAVVADRVADLRSSKQFNRELVAQGVANMVCPAFGAPPGVAMLARTVASARAGAMSRWSVFAHSLVLILFLIPLRALISEVPISALATTTVLVGWQLVNWRRFAALRRMKRADAWLFIVTFTLVVFGDLMIGVGAGLLLAMLLFIERSAASTHLVREPTHRPNEQLYRVVGPLFFASTGKLFAQLRREVTARRLLLDLEAAGPCDSSAGEFLRLLHEMQQQRGGELYLLSLSRELHDLLEQEGLLTKLRLTTADCFTTA